MLPIFSLRSVAAILIGLVVGAVAGWGYSSMSGTNAEINSGWPPIRLVSNANPIVYETSIQGRIMPGPENDTFIRNMDAEGQYYAARIDSLPFFKYYSKAIEKQFPQYAHSPEELSNMITVKYVTLADNPSVIDISASSTNSQEALFLVQNVPGVFEDYLRNEQNSIQAEVYQKILKQIDTTRNSLLQAGQDLVSTTVQESTPPITLTKEYIELSAKIASLEEELNNEAKQAANLLAQGMTPASSQPEVTPLVPAASVPQDTNPAVLDARIKGLEEAITTKEWLAAGFTLALGSSSSNLPSIPVLSQAYQETMAYIYANTIVAMERTSTELSKAKVDMNKLQAQINQEKAATETLSEQKKLAYAMTTAKINSLTAELDSQTKELQTLSPTVPDSQIPKFYTSTVPEAPLPNTPSKGTPVIGALIGMFCGWLVVNRRWLAGSTSQQPKFEEDDDLDDDLPPMKEMYHSNRDDKDKEMSDNWLNEGIYAPQRDPRPKEDDFKLPDFDAPRPREETKPIVDDSRAEKGLNVTLEGNEIKEFDDK